MTGGLFVVSTTAEAQPVNSSRIVGICVLTEMSPIWVSRSRWSSNEIPHFGTAISRSSPSVFKIGRMSKDGAFASFLSKVYFSLLVRASMLRMRFRMIFARSNVSAEQFKVSASLSSEDVKNMVCFQTGIG